MDVKYNVVRGVETTTRETPTKQNDTIEFDIFDIFDVMRYASAAFLAFVLLSIVWHVVFNVSLSVDVVNEAPCVSVRVVDKIIFVFLITSKQAIKTRW